MVLFANSLVYCSVYVSYFHKLEIGHRIRRSVEVLLINVSQFTADYNDPAHKP